MQEGQQGLSVNDLYGGRSLTPELAQRAKAQLEQRGKRGFKERARRWVESAKLTREAASSVLDLVAKDKRAEKAVAGMQRLQMDARSSRIALPPRPKIGGIVWAIGATVVPPFDTQLTWSELADGSVAPLVNAESADPNSGDMSVELWTSPNDFSGVKGEAALGSFFFPPWPSGSLQVTASLTYSYLWGLWVTFSEAFAEAFIGLHVISFDLTGAFTGVVADQSMTLWSKDDKFLASESHDGLNSVNLSAPPFQVDQQHQYVIWVWCRGEVDALGWHTFYGSAAGDSLQAAVHSITWELQPNPLQAHP